MKVIYRADLNMPRGKLIAQASHALSAFVLGCFDFENFKFRQPDSIPEIERLIKNVEILGVADAEFKQDEMLVPIEDHGRTVFKGVPTVTCGLSYPLEEAVKVGYSDNDYEDDSDEELNTRLVQLVDKAYARKDFDAAVRNSVIEQSLHLLQHMQKEEYAKSERFLTWAKGSFAKIVLVCKDGFIENFRDKGVNVVQSYFDPEGTPLHTCVIGPVHKEDLDQYTSGLKMM